MHSCWFYAGCWTQCFVLCVILMLAQSIQPSLFIPARVSRSFSSLCGLSQHDRSIFLRQANFGVYLPPPPIMNPEVLLPSLALTTTLVKPLEKPHQLSPTLSAFLVVMRKPTVHQFGKNVPALSYGGRVQKQMIIFILTKTQHQFSISQSELWLGALEICRWRCPSMLRGAVQADKGEKKSPLSFSSLSSCQGVGSWSHTSVFPNTRLAPFQALQSRRTKYFD